MDTRAWRRRTCRGRLVGVILVVTAVVAVSGGCGAFSDRSDQESTVDVDRENAEEGDVTGAPGDELEVYDLVATVTDIERIDTFSEIDNRGYIRATVTMENTSGSSIDYNRADWKIEKPDGTISNTTNVSGEPQIQDDSVPAGGSVEGTVIFAVGDQSGQFAILFRPANLTPDDPLQVERGVWVFESSPEDAS